MERIGELQFEMQPLSHISKKAAFKREPFSHMLQTALFRLHLQGVYGKRL
jgi:hypothetical protein